ncbi:MAG TPA: PQQ-dependent sugar dehydrogenase [Allosphingosinicella sp.]
MSAQRLILASPLPLILAACGGGGGSPQPQPDPTNAPPTFSSPGAATVAENSAGTIYQATATDPDSPALTFSLAGGADQGDFQITAAGALSFVNPPDFEAPDDSDANNIYQVTIAVSDGQSTATLPLSITVTNVGPDAFRVARVGAGFSQPLFLAQVPDNSGRVFVVERTGRIRILNPATGAIAATPFLDVSGQILTDGERGLLGFATAPDFATSGTFYVYLIGLTGNSEVRRYQVQAGNRDVANAGSADLILTFAQPPGFNNHKGGWIGFGNDGFLYIASGDGGSAGDPLNNAQNTGNLLGKMLRIDVAGDSFPADSEADYRIPAGNPFVAGGGRAEIWAYGLRNPFRASFDTATGNLWIGDVGQGAREEIDLMRPQDGGANFGWRILEGTQPFGGTPTAGLTPPVTEYAHGTGPRQGNSVTGGYVYRGPVESLRGQYVFGDFVTGNIWSLPIREVVLGTTLSSDRFILRRTDFTPNAGAINNISSFGIDQSGNLYIVDFDGEIFRVEAQ